MVAGQKLSGQIKRFNRRRFLLTSLLAPPLLVAADTKWIEPNWIKIRRLHLNAGKPAHRFVQITDIHHKGDRSYFLNLVSKVNELSPEFVCFTGDLIEEKEYLAEALEILAGIKAPLYGVPGNHDYWAKVSFDGIAKCFAASGGAWLADQTVVTPDGQFTLLGITCLISNQPPLRTNPSTQNILLMHYPAWVDKLAGQRFDLMLAGHSHGGQVRLPFFGALIVPSFGVGPYDLGLYKTIAGALYVNPGIGWFTVPFRFNCRPEITVFEV